jgi:hypothetical protein
MDSQSALARQTVLLVGMHRSGTSMLTRMISLMGAHVGDPGELVPPSNRNPTGYWERRDLGAVHEGFLNENGFGWSKVGGFDWNRIAPASIVQCRARLVETLARIDTSGRPLAVKDPRLCLLLPIWQQVVGVPFYVVIVRDPRHVATSIMTAYQRAFTTQHVLALWQKYLTVALQALQGACVLFVSYDRMLQDPQRENARLASSLSQMGMQGIRPLDGAELDSLVKKDLNHSGASTVAEILPSQSRLYEWLLSQSLQEAPVTVSGMPDIESADPGLIEFQQCMDEYVRWGQRQAK